MTDAATRIHDHARKLRTLGTEWLTRAENLSTELAEQAIELRGQLQQAESRFTHAGKRVRRPAEDLAQAARKLAREVRRSYEQVIDVLR
jgi:hypothetical protein